MARRRRLRAVRRRRKLIPAAGLAAWAAGHTARWAGRAALRGVKRVGTRLAGGVRKYATRRNVGLAAGAGGVGAGVAAYRRRRRAGVSRAKTTGRRLAAASEYDRVRSRYGRKRRVGVSTLMRMTVPWRKLRFQGVMGMDRAQAAGAEAEGFYPCSTTLYTGNSTTPNCWPLAAAGFADWSTATGTRWLGTPIYVINLTTTYNGNGLNPLVLYRLCAYLNASDTPTDWRWVPIYGRTTTSGLNYQPVVEDYGNSAGGSNQIPEADWIMPAWYDVRIMLRNAKAQATFFDIAEVSFSDAVLDPLSNGTDANLSNIERADRYAFLSRLASQYTVGNPIIPRLQSGVPGRYKMYKRNFKRYYMRTQQTIDEDTSANVIDVRRFIRDGRVLRYSDMAPVSAAYHTNLNELTNPAYFDIKTQTLTSGSFFPDPVIEKQRRWLMIAALDQTRTGTVGAEDTTSTSANCPSFDLVFRKKDYVGLNPLNVV